MTTTIESITAEKATQYLDKVNRQRPLRKNLSKRYAADMRNGHWLLTHQGIAFDTKGNLIDGQHRLQAVIFAGVPVKMMVTRGIPVSAENGLEVFTMDCFDAGRKRTVGEQLEMTGTADGKSIAACCVAITTAINSKHTLSTPQAREVYQQFHSEIDHVIAKRGKARGIRAASVIGSIAFAMKAGRDEMVEFYDYFTTGEGISSKGKTSPIYRLREGLVAGISAGDGWAYRIRVIRATLNACHAFATGSSIDKMEFGSDGQKFFCNALVSAVKHVVNATTVDGK